MIRRAKVTNEDLVRRYQAGDESALTELIRKNRGAIHRIASRYYPVEDARHDDYFQEATIGMMNSAKPGAFDPNVGVKFITYAWRSMTQHAHRLYIRDDVVKGPQKTPSKIRCTSLAIRIGGDDLDYDCPSESEAAIDAIIRKESAEKLNRVVEKLDRRGRDIITRRMQGETLESIGESMGITKERVRQVEADVRDEIIIRLRGGSLREKKSPRRYGEANRSTCCGAAVRSIGKYKNGLQGLCCVCCGGRSVKGVKHFRCLTVGQQFDIIRKRHHGITVRKLARDKDVSRATISDVVRCYRKAGLYDQVLKSA